MRIRSIFFLLCTIVTLEMCTNSETHAQTPPLTNTPTDSIMVIWHGNTQYQESLVNTLKKNIRNFNQQTAQWEGLSFNTKKTIPTGTEIIRYTLSLYLQLSENTHEMCIITSPDTAIYVLEKSTPNEHIIVTYIMTKDGKVLFQTFTFLSRNTKQIAGVVIGAPVGKITDLEYMYPCIHLTHDALRNLTADDFKKKKVSK